MHTFVDEKQQLNIFNLCQGHIISQLMILAGELKLYIHLSLGEKTVNELSTLTDTHHESLSRFLQAMAAIGIIEAISENTYGKTELTTQLSCISSILNGTLSYEVWGQSLYSVRTGEPAWKKVHNKAVYDFLDDVPDLSKNWDEWNSLTADAWTIPLLEQYNFYKYKKIVDIGGGTGKLLYKILNCYPDTCGVLFDREIVFEDAKKYLQDKNIINKISFVAGSFFDAIPVNGDLYICSRILVNWNDAEVYKILSNIRKAMNKNSRLLIIDIFLPSSDDKMHLNALLHDLNLFVIFGGKFRTIKQMVDIIEKSNMSCLQIIPPTSQYGVTAIEVSLSGNK